MHPAGSLAPGGAPRRRKSALERREQRSRASARTAQRLLVAFEQVARHRGQCLSKLALAVQAALARDVGAPVRGGAHGAGAPGQPGVPSVVESLAAAEARVAKDVVMEAVEATERLLLVSVDNSALPGQVAEMQVPLAGAVAQSQQLLQVSADNGLLWVQLATREQLALAALVEQQRNAEAFLGKVQALGDEAVLLRSALAKAGAYLVECQAAHFAELTQERAAGGAQSLLPTAANDHLVAELQRVLAAERLASSCARHKGELAFDEMVVAATWFQERVDELEGTLELERSDLVQAGAALAACRAELVAERARLFGFLGISAPSSGPAAATLPCPACVGTGRSVFGPCDKCSECGGRGS